MTDPTPTDPKPDTGGATPAPAAPAPPRPGKPPAPGRGKAPRRRRAIDVDAAARVRMRPLRQDGDLPHLVEPALDGVDLATWLGDEKDTVDRLLRESGGVLFRGFGVTDVAEFEGLMASVAGELLDYSYRSTPRSEVKGRVYSSTEYPAAEWIPLHNEMAYSKTWPMRIGFCCVTAAPEGGQTPVASSRAVLRRIDPQVVERFRERGVLYVRNYGQGLDLAWQEVFQTDDRERVERFCVDAGIEWEWRDQDRLRTRQVCQALARHPVTGDEVWFNQAHLFHVSSLAAETREALLSVFSEEELPRNAYYGDGSPLEAETLASIRAAFTAERVLFPWQEGDVLLLDNMLAAHGRAPFSGARKIVVGMADPHTPKEGAAA